MGQPQPTPPSDTSVCPVDHKARAAWLSQAGSSNPPHPPSSTVAPLGTTREVSSIPRAIPSSTSPSSSSPSFSPSTTPASHSNPLSANAETPTPLHDEKSGNWLYPSETQFHRSLTRKSHTVPPTLMSSIVPLHNAVNERAWSLILGWERLTSAACPPKLLSFKGDAGKVTPRARWKMLMGYKRPFDRHDWVVERCGRRVEYVIDFYEGRGAPVSFYLDVRPKLNSWEGVKMRVMRFIGL
ncbi:cytochrome c and c1 heme-lyase [Patellaria atrata CBS 101060]|uniref:Holocytochrome c-type synthase n=1 Tax=Patellaria atrata CBS 101060 TaxID=1346257 RepID=A0A9P4SE50_9PEZI|nr:cytochrome c and c1 heme-lyase [Patellaria atrata CBS 101060]